MTHPSFLRRLAGWALLRSQTALLALVLLLYSSAGPTRAQQADSTLLRQFQRANAYARAEKTEKAIKLLESLHA